MHFYREALAWVSEQRMAAKRVGILVIGKSVTESTSVMTPTTVAHSTD